MQDYNMQLYRANILDKILFHKLVRVYVNKRIKGHIVKMEIHEIK